LKDDVDLVLQVTLDHLDTPGKQEIVHARYIVGCDGRTSVVSLRDIKDRHARRCAFMGAQGNGHYHGRGADR
jgi:2-polyprenyl-6-methoxyphenol hydroxylase-like FAD-dependent oxidoreductase